MASEQDLVVETVRDILRGHEPFVLTGERRWDSDLWLALDEAGLTAVGLPEEAGGSGGELADAVAVVRTLAAGAAAVPIAEQLEVAGPAVVAAGLRLPAPLQVRADRSFPRSRRRCAPATAAHARNRLPASAAAARS